MLYIDSTMPNVIIAKNEHHRYVKCFIGKKIGRTPCSDTTCKICTSTRRRAVAGLDLRISGFINQANHIDQLIIGTPVDLEQLHNQFWTQLFGATPNWKPYIEKKKSATVVLMPIADQRQYDDVQAIVSQLKEIFDYDWFADSKSTPYNAYDLSKKLDRYTCSYCNRSYTSTVIKEDGKPVVRPTLDHWFPKTSYPLLAVSFYNLVPSCYACNSSVKNTTNLNLTDHIHPYVDAGQSKDFEFDYEYDKLNGFQIILKDTLSGSLDRSRAKNTMESMQIQHVYGTNISELRDLITIQRNYSLKYILMMQSRLKTKLSKGEVYRILFGTMFEHENFHKRPLSKFKRDILKKLGMLEDM